MRPYTSSFWHGNGLVCHLNSWYYRVIFLRERWCNRCNVNSCIGNNTRQIQWWSRYALPVKWLLSMINGFSMMQLLAIMVAEIVTISSSSRSSAFRYQPRSPDLTLLTFSCGYMKDTTLEQLKTCSAHNGDYHRWHLFRCYCQYCVTFRMLCGDKLQAHLIFYVREYHVIDGWFLFIIVASLESHCKVHVRELSLHNCGLSLFILWILDPVAGRLI